MSQIAAEKKTETLSFFKDARLESGDFHRRWKAARVSALSSVLAGMPELSRELSEEAMLKLVPLEKQDAVLRGVYDCSRKLSLSLARYLSLSAEISDYADLLQDNPIPCFKGRWQFKNDALTLTRAGCSIPATIGHFGCDYWREALDGLVIGSSDEARLARHRSVGHGDADCSDVLFSDAGTGPKLGHHRGEIPEEFTVGLRVLAQQYAQQGVAVHWDGYSEGILFYRMESGSKPLCGAGGQLMHQSLLSRLKSFFPGLQAKDGSPLAVYGGAE